MRWIRRHRLARHGIALGDVLIGGDEFGPVAGFAGSDDRLNAAAEGGVVVSVGREPNGAPAGVLHLGGGPTRLRALLAEQVWLRRKLNGAPRAGAGAAIQRSLDEAFTPTSEPAWRLEEQGYHPAAEHDVESRFALPSTCAPVCCGMSGSMKMPSNAVSACVRCASSRWPTVRLP